MSLLMFSSRLPKSPPWTKCLNFRVLQPPVGLESLKGQRKLDAWKDWNGKNTSTCDVQCTHLLEVGAGSENLVNEILYGENVIFAESFLDDTVVGKGNALLVNLAVTALVDKFADRLEVRLAGNPYWWTRSWNGSRKTYPYAM